MTVEWSKRAIFVSFDRDIFRTFLDRASHWLFIVTGIDALKWPRISETKLYKIRPQLLRLFIRNHTRVFTLPMTVAIFQGH